MQFLNDESFILETQKDRLDETVLLSTQNKCLTVHLRAHNKYMFWFRNKNLELSPLISKTWLPYIDIKPWGEGCQTCLF